MLQELRVIRAIPSALSAPRAPRVPSALSIPRALSHQCHPEGSESSETEKAPNFSVRGSGGGYLLSHFRSTIGVGRLNFSVRNGKRWIPHAITTLMRFRLVPPSCIADWVGPYIFGVASTDKPLGCFVLLVNFDFVPCFISRVADSFEGLRRGGRLVFATFPPFLFGLASLGKRSGN